MFGLPVIYFVYVETKGRSLEEIDLLFGDGQFREGAKYLHDRSKPNDEQIEKTM